MVKPSLQILKDYMLEIQRLLYIKMMMVVGDISIYVIEFIVYKLDDIEDISVGYFGDVLRTTSLSFTFRRKKRFKNVGADKIRLKVQIPVILMLIKWANIKGDDNWNSIRY